MSAGNGKATKKCIDGDGDGGDKKPSKTAQEKLASKDKKKVDQENQKGAQEDVEVKVPTQEEERLPQEKAEFKPIFLPCGSCHEIRKRWPPPPYVDPNPRDPNLLYPGDEDPEFHPVKGDVVIIHPGMPVGLIDFKRDLPEGGFIWSYDENPKFRFLVGDMVVRIGTYDGQTSPEADGGQSKRGSPKKGQKMPSSKDKNGKRKVSEAKNTEDKAASGQKKQAGGQKNEMVEKPTVAEKPPDPYHPYSKIELYTCSGFVTLEEQAQLEEKRSQEEQSLKEQAEDDAKKRKKNSKGKGGDVIKSKEDKKGCKKKKTEDAKDGPDKNLASTDATKSNDSSNPCSAVEGLDPPIVVGDAPGDASEGMVESSSSVEALLKPKWRYLGSQMQLDPKSQNLLDKQCKGLTYFYRRYSTPGTKVDLHSLTPLLGDVLINLGWLNNWYRNLEKWQREENKYKSLVTWYKPQNSCRGEVVPGMILLRPMVGRELGDWPGWGLDGKRVHSNLELVASPTPPKSDGDGLPNESQDANERTLSARDAVLLKCDCHRKYPCPKPPCPCHLSNPCPRKEKCVCIYCIPVPKKPKAPREEDLADPNTIDYANKAKKVNWSDNDAKSKGKRAPEKGAKPEREKEGGKGKKFKDKEKLGKTKGSDDKSAVTGNKDGNPAKVAKGGRENSKDAGDEKDPPQAAPPKPYSWGMVEMYLLHSREEGWDFWGRCKRVCNTVPPVVSSEACKPKYLHLEDQFEAEESQLPSKEETGKEEMVQGR